MVSKLTSVRPSVRIRTTRGFLRNRKLGFLVRALRLSLIKIIKRLHFVGVDILMKEDQRQTKIGPNTIDVPDLRTVSLLVFLVFPEASRVDA